MSLPGYPKYKYSGSPWLGDVPAAWGVQPLLGVATERSESNVGMLESNLLSLSYGRIIQKDIDSNDGLLPASFETYQIVRPGDIVLRLTDLQNDKRSLRSAIVKEQGIITSAYLALWPHKIEPGFLAYLLRAYDLTKVFYSMGGGLRQSMKFSDLKRMPVVLPSDDEQSAIAAFLDRETAKIDAMIGEQEKLIALLAEKRQATISHAVTRGLKPDAPMKDSGVTWLGDVPAYWRVIPLKHFARIGNGSTPNRDNSDYWAEDGFPWLNSSVVNQDEVSNAQQFVTAKALDECHLPIVTPPAVLVGITGQGKTRGMATRLCLTATVNQHLAYIKPDERELSVPYLVRVFEAAYDHLRTESEGAGSTKGAITCDQLGRLCIAAPSIEEQGEIIEFLSHEISKLDGLVSAAESAIDLLKERRSALISAAVTGKVDVRVVVADVSNATEELAA